MVTTELGITPLDDTKWSVTDEILEALNDYLINEWCDSKMKKSIKVGMPLMMDAINYACHQLKIDHSLIKKTAKYLAKENKLIGISPDDI